MPVVANHADVLRVVHQHFNDRVLCCVCVLILVDQDMLKFRAEKFANFWIFAQKSNGFTKQIVEIERVGFLALFFVAKIDFGDFLLEAPIRAFGKFFGRNHFVFGVANRRANRLRFQTFVVIIQIFGDFFDQRTAIVFVVNHKVFCHANTFAAKSQNSHTNPVKSPHPRHKKPVAGVRVEHFRQAFAHFFRRFIGKSHRQNLLARRAVRDQIGNSVRQSFGFSTSCARQNQHRSAQSLDGFFLG